MDNTLTPHRSLSLWLVGGLAVGLVSCDAQAPADPLLAHAQQHIETSTIDELNDALDLFARATVEQFTFATDTLERGETLIYPESLAFVAAEEDFEGVFNLGDEAFEAERDKFFGMGLGVQPPDPLPTPTQRLQIGELGGVDSSSCRSCHFAGGPDGSGTVTQLGLFRGDGQHLSASTSREAPHVMGLGYITIMARQIEADFEHQIQGELSFSQNIGEPVPFTLTHEGSAFADITAYPDGTVEIDDTDHISEDLTIRPFGHKGRHKDLVHLIDEALQLHHGLQSTARTAVYADQAETFLGEGEDPFDPDNDGRQSEVTPGQSALLASYLSMLPVPRIRPPDDPELAFVWARGQRLFTEVACASCHVPALRFNNHDVEIEVLTREELSYTIDLEEFGQEPRPINVDFGPGEGDSIPIGTPIFAFTDLRRHDMGDDLAEPQAEILPDGVGEVPGRVWQTRPLWGLADTAPYLHDGRAPTVHEAIVWHGGEGEASREAYLALDEEDRGALRLFLLSLTRDGTLLVE